MVRFAAVDVWGIDGSTFLVYYWLATAVVVGASYGYLLRARLLVRRVDVERLRPPEVGYLTGGVWGAVFVSLAWLRAAGVVDAHHGALSHAGSALTGGSRLDRAVAWAADRGSPVWQLADDRAVVRAIERLRSDLVRAGLVARPRPRRWLVVTGAVLAGLGAARFVSGPDPDLTLMFSVFVVAGATFHAGHVLTRPVTGAGRRALADLKDQWSPGSAFHVRWSGATHTDGPYAVAMRVALAGPAALLEVDPEFTAAARLTPQTFWYDPAGAGGGPMAGYHGGPRGALNDILTGGGIDGGGYGGGSNGGGGGGGDGGGGG